MCVCVSPGSIQIVRGLLMSALALGMLGFVLSLLGMECTYIGGKDRSKYKKIYAGGWCHIISGKWSKSLRFLRLATHSRFYPFYSDVAHSSPSSGLLASSGYAVYAQYVSVDISDGLQ